MSLFFKISPILSTAQTIKTRINEIENVFLPTIRQDAEEAHENMEQILQFKTKLDHLCDHIDKLEGMVEVIKNNLDKVQKQVDIADEELDIPEKKIDIFLKSINIFAKPRDPREINTNLDENGHYRAPQIFNAEEFFKKE